MKKNVCVVLSQLCFLVATMMAVSDAVVAGATESVPDATPIYAIAISEQTAADPEWAKVRDALAAKHSDPATVGELRRVVTILWKGNVGESLTALRESHPKWVCFVTTPEDATGAFVAAVHQLTRRIDDDPYTDCYWAILTGYDAECALRIAEHSEPLMIRRALAGTEIAMPRFEEGVWYSESVKHEMERKEPGGEPVRSKEGPADTTRVLAESLATADVFITSGHATQRDWQIGYAYRNGSFRCENGRLYGLDTRNEKISIDAPNPKVYLAVGNCLMGDIDGRDAMALAFMNNSGVTQLVGYTVPTWYGYGGWGVLDYFVEQPGRFSLTESFFANNQAIIFRLERYFPDVLRQMHETQTATEAGEDSGSPRRIQLVMTPEAQAEGLTPQDCVGLIHDLDTVAFYGDPAWDARLTPQSLCWDQRLTEESADDGKTKYTLDIVPNRGAESFAPINTNGSQRGGRPVFVPLPVRINAESVEIVESAGLAPVITENFVMFAQPSPEAVETAASHPDAAIRICFTARTANE